MDDLHFETAGTGDPLVLVHAGICDSGMWDPQWRSLAGSHRLLRHDMRGYGRSALPPGPYSNARDLLEVMDAAGFGRAAIVGTSLGGRVALEVALAAPDRVSGLVLVGSGLPGHEWSQAVRDYGAAEDAAVARGDLDAAAELNVRFWVDGPLRAETQVDAAVRDHVRAMQRRALELQAPVWEEADEELLVPDVGERLGEIRRRVLVLVGEVDQPDIHAIAARLVAGIPDAAFATIRAAAHLPSLERPEPFDRLVAAFLSASAPA
ncbi:MAG TPA: alpha/beta hydrolase [Gaiellales bacterium]